MKMNETMKTGLIAVMSCVLGVLGTLAFLEWDEDRKNRAELVRIAKVESERRDRFEALNQLERAETMASAKSALLVSFEPLNSLSDLTRIASALRAYWNRTLTYESSARSDEILQAATEIERYRAEFLRTDDVAQLKSAANKVAELRAALE